MPSDAKWFYSSFEGRISRQSYWIQFFAPVIAFGVLVALIDTVQGGGFWMIGFSIFLLWPALAVSAKRFHDCDFSAWWLLINLIPGGTFVAFVINGFFIGTPGPNRFGSPPLK